MRKVSVRIAGLGMIALFASGIALAGQRGVGAPPSPPATTQPLTLDEGGRPVKIVQVRIRSAVAVQQADGSFKESTLQGPIVSTVEGRHAQTELGSKKNEGNYTFATFDVLPYVNTDNTITVHVVWREEKMDRPGGGEQTRITHEAAFTRRLAPGVPTRVNLFETKSFQYFVDISATQAGGSGATVLPGKPLTP